MKAKKLLALLLSGAMAVTVATFAAACNPEQGSGTGGGGSQGGGQGGNQGGSQGGGDVNYTLDQTEYYVAGNGAGDLKQNNWSETNPCLPLVRDESADHNVFTITLDMYARDEFKIVHDNSYTGEIGFSAITPYEMMEGGYSNGDSNAKGPVSKNADGEVVFYEGGGYGGNITLELGHDGKYKFSLHTYPDGEEDTKITWEKVGDLKALSDMYVVTDMNDFGFGKDFADTSHMTKNGDVWRAALTVNEEDLCRDAEGALVKEGAEYVMVGVRNEVADDSGRKLVYIDNNRQKAFEDTTKWEYNLLPAGVYTITYNGSDNSVTITEGARDMYFIGTVNDWSTDMSADWALKEDLATGVWSGMITVDKDEEVKLYNKLDGHYYPDGMDNNIKLSAGEWAFTFDPATSEVKYEKLGYFVIGTFVDADNHMQNFVVVKDLTPAMTANDDGLYTAVVNVTDVSGVAEGNNNYGWLTSEGGGAIFAIKVVYGSALMGVKEGDYWFGVGEDNANYFFHEAGEYTVTFDPDSKAITVAPVVHNVTVTFDLNYDDATGAPEMQTVTQGQTATKPAEDPTRDTYIFYGWYTEAECNNKFDFTTPVNDDIILYARWELASDVVAGVKVTFNYHDNSTQDAEVTVDEKGLVAEPQAPSREGYYFLGWFTAASDGQPFDFDQIVKEDATVHAQWRAIDTHNYHIVGKLKSGGIADWNPEDESLSLVHSDKHPTENVFTISIRLFAGDEFKILGVTNWDDGFSFGAWAISGVDCGDGLVYAEVGNDGGNIKVNVSGDYVLYASTETWKLTWTVEPFANPNDMYFVYDGNETKMGAGADAWTGYFTVDGTKELKLVDKYDGNKEYPVGEGNLEAGDYFVKFDVEKKEVSYEKLEYYIVGTLVINGKAVSFSIAEGSPKLVKGADGKYSVELDVTDVTGNSDYSWMATDIADQKLTAGTIMAIKVGYGSVLGGVKDWYGDYTKNDVVDNGAKGDNLCFHEAGKYTVTFDGKTITVTKAAA